MVTALVVLPPTGAAPVQAKVLPPTVLAAVSVTLPPTHTGVVWVMLATGVGRASTTVEAVPVEPQASVIRTLHVPPAFAVWVEAVPAGPLGPVHA